MMTFDVLLSVLLPAPSPALSEAMAGATGMGGYLATASVVTYVRGQRCYTHLTRAVKRWELSNVASVNSNNRTTVKPRYFRVLPGGLAFSAC